MKIKSGDTIEVIAGKDKKKKGKVLRVYLKQSRVLVENINMYKKHVKKSEQMPQGGVIEVSRPIHISNIKKTESSKTAKNKTK
jgi:large subunit ribosomal protein L24